MAAGAGGALRQRSAANQLPGKHLLVSSACVGPTSRVGVIAGAEENELNPNSATSNDDQKEPAAIAAGSILCECPVGCCCWESLAFLLLDGDATPTEAENEAERAWQERETAGTEVVTLEDDQPAPPPDDLKVSVWDDGRDHITARVAQLGEPPDDDAWSMRYRIPAVRVQLFAGARKHDVVRLLQRIVADLDSMLAGGNVAIDRYVEQQRSHRAASTQKDSGIDLP